MTKNYLIIVILSLIMLSSLVYGIFESGTPWDTRSKKFDQTRISDLNNIKLAIDNYYLSKYSLPQSLDELKSGNSYSYYKDTDPETNQAYVYKNTSSTSYQLCANFSQKSDDKNNANTTLALPYNGDSSFKHPQGNYCFDFKVNPTNSITTRKVSILSKSLAQTAIASGSARSGATPVSSQIFTDPNIQSVSTSLYSYYNSITASDPKYSAQANYPTGFFSDNQNEWGLISISGGPTTVTVNFKSPVKLKSITSDFTPGCPDNINCIEWKISGTTGNGLSVNLFSGYGGNKADTASIDVAESFTKIDITASMTSAHDIGYLYWRKIKFEYQ